MEWKTIRVDGAVIAQGYYCPNCKIIVGDKPICTLCGKGIEETEETDESKMDDIVLEKCHFCGHDMDNIIFSEVEGTGDVIRVDWCNWCGGLFVNTPDGKDTATPSFIISAIETTKENDISKSVKGGEDGK